MTINKIDAETGEEIAVSAEEEERMKKAMRDAIAGQNGMQIVMAPEVLEQLKAKGLTEDELLAMLADSVDAKQ